MSELDLSVFWCWNKDCPDYGKKNHGNIALKERKGKSQHALLRCRTCKKCFSETRGTIFFGLLVEPDKVLRALALLPEKGGIRGVARLTGHSKNTIKRWIKVAGQHAQKVNEFFLRDLELTQVQIDEIWVYIKKREKFDIDRS